MKNEQDKIRNIGFIAMGNHKTDLKELLRAIKALQPKIQPLHEIRHCWLDCKCEKE